MLDFLSGDIAKVVTFPGGLAAVSQGIYERLLDELPENYLRASCLAIDIRSVDGKVQVCYKDSNDQLHTVMAKTCIFAGPKFIARRICQDVPQLQRESWNQINYRAYLVANVILDSPVASPGFDLFCLQGKMPQEPTFLHPGDRAFSDLCFGSWAQEPQGTSQNAVLTVYKGLPYDGSNQHLFIPSAHDHYKRIIVSALEPILQSLGKSRNNIVAVRLTRFGHPIPVARKDLIGKGIVQTASQPIGGSLYFVNQDNWASASFETVIAVAQNMTTAIRNRPH